VKDAHDWKPRDIVSAAISNWYLIAENALSQSSGGHSRRVSTGTIRARTDSTCSHKADDGIVGANQVEQSKNAQRIWKPGAEEHSQMVNEIRDSLRSLESRVDKRFEQVEQRFIHLEERMDRRFEQVELRLSEGFSRADARFEAMDAKMSRHFVWLAGMLLTTLIAMLGTLGAIVAATIR
jgi:hypothetical protein